jgi:glyoxylase-like metal-dependent hydrolase (beta-lactamase superfamily II)
MQVVPGVYLANGFPYGRHQNSYVICTDKATVMVDCGDLEEESFDSVVSACSRWGFGIGDVSHLLLTHAHFDHSSNAARLRRQGAKVVASLDTAAAIGAGDERCIGYAVGREFERCHTDVIARPDERLPLDGLDVRCLWAPGHTRGLTVYEVRLNGELLWFCGDLVQIGPDCASVELGWAGGPDYDRKVYLDTLRKLAQMDCDTLLAGHGPPAIGMGRRLIQMAYTKAMLEWR